jgi:hypothetical protein
MNDRMNLRNKVALVTGAGWPMTASGHERLGAASCRRSNVRNAPLATVGLKKAACREGRVARRNLTPGRSQIRA